MQIKKDVVVIGGGAAGTAAAVAAARRGHKVLLVEEQNCLGGVSTAGGVCGFFAHLEGLGDIFESVTDELDLFGARSDPGGMAYNPEYLKWCWQKVAEESGAEILFHATLSGAEREKGVIKSAQVLSCSRSISAEAKFFIDASGEGDLGEVSGASMMKGDPETGLTLHMTLTAWMFDTGKPAKIHLPEGLEPINNPGDLPGLGAGGAVWDGRVCLNSTKIIRHDPTDPVSLSRAELQARRQLMRLVHYIQRKHFPSYMLGGTGSTIGIREGSRIEGDYILKGEEILDRDDFLSFEDGIAVATSQIDFHSLSKQGLSGWRERVKPYSIPLRCLTAKGFENLLAAGKCISADQAAHSSARMIPTCCAMGQAAGTAAALAIEAGVKNIRDISVKRLREVLSADKMELDPARHSSFGRDNTTFLEPDDAGPERGKGIKRS